MGNRRMTVAAAVVAGVIVLLVALFAGGGGVPNRERLSPEELLNLKVNTGFNPDAAGGDTTQLTGAPIQEAGPGVWILEDRETGRVTRHQWDHIIPQPGGVYNMENPVTRIIFSPAHVIEITAARGLFSVEEKQFQNGTLTGDIVIRLLETRDGSPVDLKTDRDLQMKLLMDDAEFDMELGELVSKSVVRVTGPRIAFRGQGLVMNYNRRFSRLDRLIIERDIDLWFKPGGDTGATSTASGRSDARAAEDAADSEQLYIARFEDGVVVDAEEGHTHMTGDFLTAVFALGGEGGESLEGERHRGDPPSERVGFGWGEKGGSEGDLDLAGENFRGGVHIVCEGRLIVEPYDFEKVDLDGGVLLGLESKGVGGGVSIVRGEGENITAAKVDYLTTTGRVRAEAGEGVVMRIVSGELGELTGRSLSFDPTAGVGHVIGPGVLVLASEDRLSDAGRIDWADRLDLTFFTDGVSDDAALAIRTATFSGDAHVRHPELNLDGETLIATFERGEDMRSQLRAIDAAGDVEMVAKQRDGGDGMSMESDAMHIDMARGEDGRDQPRRLVATGHVIAQQPGMLLEAQSLDAELGFVGVADEESSPGRLTVKHLTAARGVVVTMDDPTVRLIGERMLVEVETGQVELFGTSDAPARAVRSDGELSGPRLVLDKKSETVYVVGAGLFTFDFVPEAGSDERAHTLTVTSTDTMLFNQQANFAQFVGDVVATDRSATEETVQTCDDLRLDFEGVGVEGVEVEGDVVGNGGVEGNPRSQNVGFGGDSSIVRGKASGGLRIRTATARGGPVLRSRSFSADEPDVDLTRFHLEGPLMTFDNSPGHELAQVIGAGKMLIEDYRPTDESGESMAERETASPLAVAISGRGQTLFVWQKQMTLDAARHDMLMEQQVQMVHRPTGADAQRFGEVVLLDCRKLYADLSNSQGMDGWLSDSSPKLNINMIIADRDVRIVQARKRAYCDRLIYNGAKNRVELLAARGKLARIEDEDQPVPMTGEAFNWDLDTDIFNVMRPGAATVPLPR